MKLPFKYKGEDTFIEVEASLILIVLLILTVMYLVLIY